MEWIIIGLIIAGAGPAIIEGLVGLVAMLFRLITGTATQVINTGVRSAASKSERERVLSQASYGVLMLAGAYYFPMPLWGVAVLAIWGIAWLLTGVGWRSRGFRDGTLIQKFLVRLAIGIAALIWVPPYPEAQEPLRLIGYALCITALVKLVLVMRGAPAQPGAE